MESKREYQVKQKSLNFSSSRTYHFLLVELEGIEPSSKRGNHKLSTCLSLPKFSCSGRTKAINRCLIPPYAWRSQLFKQSHRVITLLKHEIDLRLRNDSRIGALPHDAGKRRNGFNIGCRQRRYMDGHTISYKFRVGGRTRSQYNAQFSATRLIGVVHKNTCTRIPV